ncbi:hypothetical protein DRQ36_08640 [bacterium]|nr:MAG: hypothetical protein DRQ36_08640 [bacterium]
MTENSIEGAVNLDELSWASTSDILVYLVEFEGGGMARVDSVHPEYDGRYEFSGFDFGVYGIEAETVPGATMHYYGFRDGDYDGVFEQTDALYFSSFAHIDCFNVPMYEYGYVPDTIEFESEPNDDAGNAQDFGIMHLVHISGGYLESGGFEYPDNYTGDRDLYKFECIWDGYLEIVLSWTGGADLDLFLWDRYGIDIIEQVNISGDYSPISIFGRSVYRHDEYIVGVMSADDPATYDLSIRIR